MRDGVGSSLGRRDPSSIFLGDSLVHSLSSGQSGTLRLISGTKGGPGGNDAKVGFYQEFPIFPLDRPVR